MGVFCNLQQLAVLPSLKNIAGIGLTQELQQMTSAVITSGSTLKLLVCSHVSLHLNTHAALGLQLTWESTRKRSKERQVILGRQRNAI